MREAFPQSLPKGKRKKRTPEEEEAEAAAAEAADQTDTRGIEISTVDAFQGAEKGAAANSLRFRAAHSVSCLDVIIVSCSRTSRYQGFIDSPKRLNVVLTRAKRYILQRRPRSHTLQTPAGRRAL
jgi:superfamily I DNA and/or RNA helicase